MKNKYDDIIGIPSGEVLVLPTTITYKLKEKDLIYKNFIYDGHHYMLYYVYDDSDYEKIFNFLKTIIDDYDW